MEIRLRNDIAELPRVVRDIDEFARAQKLAEHPRKSLQLIVEEIVTNVMRHGYNDAERDREIIVRLADAQPPDFEVEIEVSDEAVDRFNRNANLASPIDTFQRRPRSDVNREYVVAQGRSGTAANRLCARVNAGRGGSNQAHTGPGTKRTQVDVAVLAAIMLCD